MARDTKQPLAQTFLSADCVVLVDTSASMDECDSSNGRSRYEVACSELTQLQANLPGKVAVLSFSSHTMFCPDGVPFNQGGGTDLADALKFARVADVVDMRFIVISDGEPQHEVAALAEAEKYKNKIDVIYVGPENRPSGRNFLKRLAAASGGQIVTADRSQGLLAAATRLLEVAA